MSEPVLTVEYFLYYLGDVEHVVGSSPKFYSQFPIKLFELPYIAVCLREYVKPIMIIVCVVKINDK